MTALPLLAWILGLLPVAHATETVQRRLAIMGTWLDVSVSAANRPQALNASEAAVRAVEATNRRLSSWRSDSELSALNTAPVGVWQALSPELAVDLQRARWCSARTGGAFDPVLGPLVEARGLRTDAPTGSEQLILSALDRSGWAGVGLDGLRARRLRDTWLDAGGFGKGVALDAGLDAAQAAGATDVVLDLGGQLAVRGAAIELSIADPADRQRGVGTLWLRNASAATSGQGEQPGHLFDPRTGEIAPNFGTITVIARSAAVADCLSTGLYVLGPERALAFGHDLEGVDVVVVQDGPSGISLRTSRARSTPVGDPR